MSSLAGAERPVAPAGAPAPASAPARRTVTIPVPRSGAHVAIGCGVAIALVAAAFIGTGGLALERTTDVLIACMLAGAALAATALVRRARSATAPLYGGAPLAAIALLAALTALSIVWSVAPADSWFEAERTLAYVAVFAAGMALSRLAPGGWAGLLAGVGLACVLVSAWALLTKVFPASLAGEEIYARLRQPFQYWNSVGLMAAMGVPPMLWLAARRSGHGAVNALAWPALVLLLTCLMLAYSRGALLALVVGVAAWFALVPLRLRGLVALAAGILGAGVLVAWTLAQDGLSTDNPPLSARVDAGHELGALLVLVCTLALAAGLAVHFAVSQRPPERRVRRAAGATALAILALVPVVALSALASAPGGVGGQVSKGWRQLTDTNARPPDNSADRLVATSSVRARYWAEALDIHAVSPWVGAGAGGYATARTPFRKDALAVRQAHGYVVQTLADLGWAGLAVSLLALFAWLACAARALGLGRRDWRLPWDAERVGLATLAVVVAIFGVHSTVDWTWFVPANAACALLCAGWIAGRGPLRARMERAAVAPAPGAVVPAAVVPAPGAVVPAAVVPATGAVVPAAVVPATAWPAPGRLPRLRRGGPAAAWLAAVLVLVIALAAAWSAYQPVRAVHASNAAFDRLDAGAPDQAAAIARIAARRNPLSVDPLFDLAAIEQSRGRIADARIALERAVRLQPANADAWSRLGRLRLSVLGDRRGALRAFRAAYFLDPQSPQTASDLLEATRAPRG